VTRAVEEVLAEAIQLPFEERSRLAEELFSSLKSSEEQGIAAEWAAVAAQRLAEYERGDAETVSLEEALEHARRAVRDVASQTARRG
jgi:putative addiction module component (TIGR02574 family)